MTVTPVIPVKQHHHAPVTIGTWSRDRGLSPGARSLCLVLASRRCHLPPQGRRTNRVKITTLVRDLDRSPRQIHRYLDEATAAGYLTITRTGRSSAYLLHHEPCATHGRTDLPYPAEAQINPFPERVNQHQGVGVDKPQPQPHVDVAHVGIVAILDTAAADQLPGEPLPIGSHLANVNPEPRGQEQPHTATHGSDVDMAAIEAHLPQHLRPKRNPTARRLVADLRDGGMTAAEIGRALADRISRLSTPPRTPGYIVQVLRDPDLCHTTPNPAARSMHTTMAAPPSPPIVRRQEDRSPAEAIAAATPRDEAEEPLTDADRAETQQLLDGFRSGSTYRKTCRTIARTRTPATTDTDRAEALAKLLTWCAEHPGEDSGGVIA